MNDIKKLEEQYLRLKDYIKAEMYKNQRINMQNKEMKEFEEQLGEKVSIYLKPMETKHEKEL